MSFQNGGDQHIVRYIRNFNFTDGVCQARESVGQYIGTLDEASSLRRLYNNTVPLSTLEACARGVGNGSPCGASTAWHVLRDMI